MSADDPYLSIVERLSTIGDEMDGYKSHWGSLGDGVAKVAQRGMRFSGNAGAAASELNLALEIVPPNFKDQVRDAFERGYPKCATPIEVAMLAWLLAQEYPPFFNYNPMCLLPGEGDSLTDRAVAVIPQLPIGNFRVDFALAAKNNGLTRFLIVECDGEAYHGAPNQVMRDLNRDVKILSNPRVLDIVRIPAMEIFNSPQKAAESAAWMIKRVWDKNNTEYNHKFGVKETAI